MAGAPLASTSACGGAQGTECRARGSPPQAPRPHDHHAALWVRRDARLAVFRDLRVGSVGRCAGQVGCADEEDAHEGRRPGRTPRHHGVRELRMVSLPESWTRCGARAGGKKDMVPAAVHAQVPTWPHAHAHACCHACMGCAASVQQRIVCWLCQSLRTQPQRMGSRAEAPPRAGACYCSAADVAIPHHSPGDCAVATVMTTCVCTAGVQHSPAPGSGEVHTATLQAFAGATWLAGVVCATPEKQQRL